MIKLAILYRYVSMALMPLFTIAFLTGKIKFKD